jgi:hypothetical protein
MHPLSILLFGDFERAEFFDARAGLERFGTVHQYAGVDEAADAMARAEFVPDVIVAAQAFPGQVSQQAIDRLRRLAPLARVVGLLGSWCEGEMRSGSPWPGVVRTYWHQWPARSARELYCMANGHHCSWSLPPTATEEERLLADMNACGIHTGAPLDAPRGLVSICGRSRETAEWLSAACRKRGFSTVWRRSATAAESDGVVAGIYDGTDLTEDSCDELRRLAAALHPAPVVALLAFPRIEDRQRALSAGAASVLSKPLSLEDLFTELDRALGCRANSR